MQLVVHLSLFSLFSSTFVLLAFRFVQAVSEKKELKGAAASLITG